MIGPRTLGAIRGGADFDCVVGRRTWRPAGASIASQALERFITTGISREEHKAIGAALARLDLACRCKLANLASLDRVVDANLEVELLQTLCRSGPHPRVGAPGRVVGLSHLRLSSPRLPIVPAVMSRFAGTTTGSACRGTDRPPPGVDRSRCHVLRALRAEGV